MTQATITRRGVMAIQTVGGNGGEDFEAESSTMCDSAWRENDEEERDHDE